MTKVFCIGNGESRKDFDLNKLKPHGKIYGCNALYRDFTPDVLISVDNGIMHEIYDSRYCYNNETWFRNWNKKNSKEYEKSYFGENITQEEIDFIKKYYTNITENNKAHDLNEIFPNRKEFGWSAGATSGYIAIKQNNPKEVYLIGHDFTSNTPKVNNMYKDTKWYAKSTKGRTPGINWRNQWRQLFRLFPNITFYKVNNSLEEINNINKKIKEWKDTPNLVYTTYEQSFSNW